jgi:hypothetical protein
VSGVWQVRRRTHTTYTSIGGAVNLPTEVDVYDALLDTSDANDVMIAKSTYAYDNYASMGGMEYYNGAANPPGHLSWYNTSLTTRGNVTGTTQWTDVTGGTVIQHQAKYDIFGNVVKAQVSCCQEKDLTNTDANYWSAPVEETSGDPNGVHETTSTDYDFNTSLPVSTTDAAGLTTNVGYNAALTVSSVTLPTGATATAGYDYVNLTSTSTTTYDDGTDQDGKPIKKTVTSSKVYDGWGRITQMVDKNNSQVNSSYDSMGRVSARTNPFVAGGTPGTSTTIQYDLANKAIITTLPDGNITRIDYSGSTTTATDQVNRKIQKIADGLGRLITTNEQDATASLSQSTTYAYNLLDKLTQVNQGGQLRNYKYDSVGRLLYEKAPEQSATIDDGSGTMWSAKYSYTEFSAVNKKTDARGVELHQAFDSLHRAVHTWYTGIGGDDQGNTRPALPSGVAATPDVYTNYDSAGAVSGVTMSLPGGANIYSESSLFDEVHRVSSATKTLDGKSYVTGYQYNGASQMKQITYPSGNSVNTNYDDRGRMSDMPGYLNGMTYNAAGQVTGFNVVTSSGNTVLSESFGYDATRLQLTSQVATKNGGPTGGLMNLNYSYQATAGQMGAGIDCG